MKNIKKLIVLLMGNLLLAVGVSVFYLPNDILSGGVSGIAVLIKDYLPISQSLFILLFNIVLLILSIVLLGKDYFISAVFSSIVYPIMMMFIPNFMPTFIGDHLLASLFGGLLTGAGIGLVFRENCSTGGMDIPPLIINKYTGLDVSKGVLIVDSLTVLLGLMLYDFEAVLIGILSVISSSYAIKYIMSIGLDNSKQIQIVSNKYQEISKEIQDKLDRGTTIIKAKGGYTGEDKDILMVVVSNKQYHSIIEIAKKYDNNAFIIVSDIDSVHGEGFTYFPKV